MTQFNRFLAIALATTLLLAIASPAFASEEEGEHAEETTETTVAVDPYADGEAPAVIIPPEEAEEAEQPWTARFLIPLLVVTAILLIIGVAIAYNSSIRTRYKVTA